MAYINGQTGNPRGRPRNVNTNYTNVDTELKKQAAKKSKKAFDFLWKAIEAREPWAFQLYFQELVPKADILPLEIDQDHPNKIDAVIAGLLKSIDTLEYVTLQEVCELLNALGNVVNAFSNLKLSEGAIAEELYGSQILKAEKKVVN